MGSRGFRLAALRESFVELKQGTARVAAGWLLAASTAVVSGQQFVSNTTDIPQVNPASSSESLAFADVDLDGDLDVAFANGGVCCDEQNVLWVNQGGTQGGILGVFADETATRFPTLADASHDIAFADIDGDGDPDMFVANTDIPAFQSSRFWINQGPAPAQAGFFVDETSTRWVGLGGPGSSVAASLLVPSGGFRNRTHAADLADLDNDGDLDLVLTASGPSIGGAPARMFLNDGNGFFSEFNPSGHQLVGAGLPSGAPGLWCEGVQQSQTSDTTGVECDIVVTAEDLDFADLDGDLDIDVLLGDTVFLPRMFRNRLEETGALAFRDVSDLTFVRSASSIGSSQEFGDLDNDGDLDLYGPDFVTLVSDTTYENDGAGFLGNPTNVPGTAKDALEATLLDYDNDGDLDVFIANVFFEDTLHRNDSSGPGITFSNVSFVFPGRAPLTRYGRAADVDGDHDTDLFTARPNNLPSQFLENQTAAVDTHAPRLLRLEQVPDAVASSLPRVVRVQVYDNAPGYVTARNETFLEVTVDGGPAVVHPMVHSGAQIFRGEIPGQLVGNVKYRAFSRDASGNEGRSSGLSYQAAQGGCDSLTQVYCTAKTSSAGCTPGLSLASCVSATELGPAFVAAGEMPNRKNGILFYGFGAAALPWLGGTLCVQPPLRCTDIVPSGGSPPPANDCSGTYQFDLNGWVQSGMDASLVPGTTIHAQYQARDPQGTFGVVTSNAVQLTIEP